MKNFTDTNHTTLELKVIDLEVKNSKLKVALRSVKNQREFEKGTYNYRWDSTWMIVNEALNAS